MTLLVVANGQYGYVTADDARALGIDPGQLRLMHHRGLLDRLSRGLYRFPIVPTNALDQYMEATLWPRTPTVLSHDTALDLHEISDANPAHVHLTVPPGFRKRIGEHVVLHTGSVSNAEWEDYGGYRVTTPLRTILDIASSPVSWTYLNSAVDDALRRGLLRQKELQALVHSSTNPGRERIQEALGLYASKAGELAGSR